MNIRHSLCVMAALLSCLLNRNFVKADDTAEEIETGPPITSMTKAQYESEAIALAGWKSRVQGSQMGDRLINYLTVLDANLVRNNRDTLSLYNRGYLYGTIGCTRAAIVDLAKAIQADPMAANLYCERGICYMDMGDYGNAKKDLDMAISLNSFSGDALLARGRLYLLLNKPELAMADLNTCKQSHTVFSPALPGELPANFYGAPDYYLGICCEMLGKYSDALDHYKSAAQEVTGADSGYIHRYADRPLDVKDRVNRLQSG